MTEIYDTLFKHQMEGLSFLKEKKKAILAHDMGLGKTLCAIVAARDESTNRTLVVCPASLKINWQREIQQWVGEEAHIITGGTPRAVPDKMKWAIINYDILDKHKVALEGNYDTIILDEAHYIKDDKTIRSKAALELCKNVERVYLLTGTPMLNRPIELYPLLQAVDHPLGRKGAKTAYAMKFCGGEKKALVRDLKENRQFFVDPKKVFPYMKDKKRYRAFIYTDSNGATNLVELRESLKKCMQRRLKKEALDLPEKIVSTVTCELSRTDRARYESAFDDYVEWLSNHPQGDKNIDNILLAKHLVEIQKVKQVCSESKLERIREAAENASEQGQKVIIFSQYTNTIESLARELKGSVTLTGEDSGDTRQAAVDKFQTDPETKYFIANIKAGGVGITLTAASIVMFADMEWSPEIHAQAEDRAHRIGQNGTVNVYYFVAEDTIEEDIMEMLKNKKAIITEVLEGKSKRVDTGGIQKHFIQTMLGKMFE